jgi:hypothetical protein
MPVSDLTPESAAAVLAFFKTEGYETSETNIKQFGVLMDAFEIFLERNKDRQDLWREAGWEDSALHVKSKGMRVGQAAILDSLRVNPGVRLDDAYDVINYAAFFIRNILDPA